MDFRTHVLQWERMAQENPAVIGLVVVALIAFGFIMIVLVDAVVSRRKKNANKRQKAAK